MLVLTRKKNESILIGEDIEVLVLEIKGDQVKLGVRAPKQTSILRKEVYEGIKTANKQAVISVDHLDLLEKLKKNDE